MNNILKRNITDENVVYTKSEGQISYRLNNMILDFCLFESRNTTISRFLRFKLLT